MNDFLMFIGVKSDILNLLIESPTINSLSAPILRLTPCIDVLVACLSLSKVASQFDDVICDGNSLKGYIQFLEVFHDTS